MSTEVVDMVRSALRNDGRIVSRSTIHASVKDGSVILHGVVDSLEEFGLAQEVVESVPGVQTVQNHLTIDGDVDTGPCCPQM